MGCATTMEEDFAKMDVMKVSEEDLRRRKRDRERMSEEFRHFLQENLKKSSSHDDNKSQIECEQSQQKVVNSLNVAEVVRNLNESPRSPLRLSPHDGDGMKAQHGISSSVMSIRESPTKMVKQTPPHGGRTADEEPTTSACKKVRSYDPIETRRYMRCQQKKRQVELRKMLTVDQERKQEIQKRLAELQESTRRILGKSVRQKCVVGKVDKSSTGSQKVAVQDAIKGSIKKPPRTSGTESMDGGNFHRVSIAGAPKVPRGVNTNAVDKNLVSDRNKSNKFEDKSSRMKSPQQRINVSAKRPPEEKLEVPSHLSLSPSRGDKSSSRGVVPHWLRPTSVNAHPYNFITAVREKLDAISHVQPLEKAPNVQGKSSIAQKDFMMTTVSKGDKWTDLNRWSVQQEHNAKRGRSVSQSLDTPLKPSGVKKKSDTQKSVSEGLLTHLSSVSLHVPESNTISDISSIQSEIFPSSIRLSGRKNAVSCGERASVSDGGKSPEARMSVATVASGSVKGVVVTGECIAPIAARDNNQLSPLSTELVDTMRIMSPRGKREEKVAIAKEISDDDGNNDGGGGKMGEFRSLSSDKFQPLDTSANKVEIHEGNLTDLLEAFNRSLTQVIQMNQQLYSALNKSPNKAIAVHNPAEAEVKSAAGEAEQMHEYEESFEEEEEANSTVKSAGGEARKASDDAIGGQESAREIDNSKGDKSGEIVNCRANKSSEEANGPQARAIEGNVMDARETNSTIGSDIFAVFNQTDMEVSYISSGGDEARETSITYSNIGLFEQMIKTEKMKGDRLFKMIRTREKALIDRTRGQIAWLELQKKRFKEKGGILQISAIRKKQRAILLKLERERGELQRQMRSQPTSPTKKSPSHRVRVVEKTISNVVSLRRSPLPALENRGAVKGFEMAAGTTLEKLLEQREKELQKRREHVEFLLQWHQRLEREEKNVREMENKLLNSNLERIAEKQNLQALTDGNEEEEKSSEAMKRVEDIDKSLEILHNIVQESGSEADFVAVRGAKLNYLWKKLVGKEEEKFSPESVIKMTKEDFSQLYEDAKIRILREFDDEKKIRQLMDESVASVTRESNSQHSTEAEEEEEEEENTEKCEEQPFPGYSTDDFETVAESEKVVESGLEEAETNVVKSPEESFQEECSKNDQTEDQSHSEATRDSINREEALITAEESVKSEMNLISEAFSPEILSQAEEEQLISEMTLPSFSDTTIADETIVEEEAEGLEESEQTEDRSDDIVVNSENSPNSHDGDAENGLDSDLSAHSKHENLDKTLNISQESLNTAQDVESVTLESFEDDEGGEEVQSELEKRIIQVDVSLKDLSSAMEKSPILEALSPRETSSSASTGSSNSSPEASVQSGEESRASTSSERLESVANGEDNSSQESSSRFIQENYAEVYPKSPDDSQGSGSFSQQKIRDYKIPNRMPDIISEAELLRRQQMQIEQEIKQLEQSVPAVFLREIPNKPPPPYVPPAQDSPLATIFPSEDRVMELVNDRTKELYFSVNSGKAIAESASDCSSITNVYEKIVVGMCEEIFGDINETLDTQYDAPFQRVRLYRNKLAFFNPPDRLACIQDHILESIARILPGLGSMPRQTLQLPANSRRKRDQIDEIVIEEMLEDDWKWSNFQIEETEVLDTMTETIFSTLLEDAIRDIDVAYTKKFPHNS